MILIRNLRLGPEEKIDALPLRAAKKLRVSPEQIIEWKLIKKSLDARKKDDLHWVYTVAVTVEVSRARVSLSIRDNGPGIPRGELRRVMLPFVSSKSKNTNWGVGLPYAFRVINAQLGQIRIRSSDQPGRSFTEVDILLPRERSRDRWAESA